MLPKDKSKHNEYRKKLSNAIKRSWNNPIIRKKYLENNPRGKGLPAWNKDLTKETDPRVAKYSNALLGRPLSKKHKENASKGMKKWWAKIPKNEKLIYLENWMFAGRVASQIANPSPLEIAIWEVLDSLEIKFETQYRVGEWLVDIYIPDRNLIIEVNGNHWHDYKMFPKTKIRDDTLEKYAKDNGYKFIWIWENEIKENPKLALVNGLQKLKN